MLLLGIDLGTSSIKVAVTDALTHRVLATAQYPDTEAVIVSKRPGWAEQSPDGWWEYVQKAIGRVHASGAYDPMDIGAIGIAYQMHGLVLVDKAQQVLRDSIIWCDSRAVPYGDRAFAAHAREALVETKLCNAFLLTGGELRDALLRGGAQHRDPQPAV